MFTNKSKRIGKDKRSSKGDIELISVKSLYLGKFVASLYSALC